MWSDKYWYYNIRSDGNYSKELPSAHIVAVLLNTGALKSTGQQTFTNEEGFPWINVSCVKSNNGNFTHDLHTVTEYSNLIAIEASRLHPENESKYIALFTGIAMELGWELVLESDDVGNEDVILYRC